MLARDDHIFYQNLLKGKTNMFRAGRNQNNIAFNLNITKCQNPWNWHLSTTVHFHIFFECFSLPKLCDSFIQLRMIMIFICLSWEIGINQRMPLRTKGSMLLVAVLTYQRAERLVGLVLYVGREISMAGKLIGGMYFSLWMQIKYGTVGTKPISQYLQQFH